ncbi:MAG: hypothetical protein IKS55_07355 [Oscillospiraceae bacterium]|nr:hypothetical protein [Oscillospiraceae bacterium]
MVIQEIWAIPLDRIERFFQSQNDVRPNGDDGFSFGQCKIRITSMSEREIGSLRFPQTQMEFEGPDADTEEIHRRFVLQFISAGG